MPQDLIRSCLLDFRDRSKEGNDSLVHFCRESPLERTRREIQRQLQEAEDYRMSILQNVTTFAGLTEESILNAARSMEEIYFQKGEHIIVQDDIGDSFFVLEEGTVVVTRKMNPKDPTEAPKELAHLKKNAHFGEIALLTADPRSATITVTSDEAKCLKMTKMKFDELLATTNNLAQESRKQIGKDVLDTVPLFKSLSSMNKKKLLEAMMPMTYLPGSYICRQGTTGNAFFILTEGSCKVTINMSESTEREVAKLHPGDFFGEVALIEAANRRTANVISIDTVSCLTLSRNDFNSLLKGIKMKIMEHQAMRSSGQQSNDDGSAAQEVRQHTALARKRRISVFNTHGQRDEHRVSNLLRRFARFSTESLWNSLYSRMYREMLLEPSKVVEYGKFASFVMKANDTRFEAVTAINEQAIRILEMDCARRTASDHAFVLGLLKQRNVLKDRLCKNWPAHQFALLCKKVKMIRAKSLRKIIEVDTHGTTAYLILRGCVRIYTRVNRSDGVVKTYFEEDLFPGDIFGETALAGNHTRNITALAVTACDMLVIDDQDFVMAQDRDSVHMGTEERSKFLSQVPMFRNWDSYKLLRLAHVLVQEEIDKGTVLITHGSISKDFFFIINGKVEVQDSLEKKNVITTLTSNDFFGESGFCNKFTKSLNHKVAEEYYTIAASKLDVLIFHEANFSLFDIHSIDLVKQAFKAKQDWRRDRVRKMKHERALMRMQYHIMHLEADRMMMPGAATMNPLVANSAITSNLKTQDRLSPLHSAQNYPLKYPIEVPNGNNNSGILQNLPHARIVQESRPSSPVGNASKSLLPQGKPTSRQSISLRFAPITQWSVLNNVEYNENEEPEAPNEFGRDCSENFISATDFAYRQALIHPLDERYDDEEYWKSATSAYEKKKSALDNIHEIPALLAKDFSMIMVAASMKHPREFDKIQDLVLTGKKSVSPKRQQLQLQVSLSRRGIIVSSPNKSQSSVIGGHEAEKLPGIPAFIANLRRPTSGTQRRPLSATSVGKKTSTNQSDADIPQMFIHSLQNNNKNSVSEISAVPAAPKFQRPVSANAMGYRGFQQESSIIKGITTSNPTLQQIFHSNNKVGVKVRPQSASALHSSVSSPELSKPILYGGSPAVEPSLISVDGIASANRHIAFETPCSVGTNALEGGSCAKGQGHIKALTLFSDDVLDDNAINLSPKVAPPPTKRSNSMVASRPPLLPNHPGAKRGVLARK